MDPPTRPRRKQAVDYLLLNDGYEGDEPMENIVHDKPQDLLGLRRHSMESGTMRKLTLLADHYSRGAEW
ncbi:hypothetical protein V1507DRAFT_447714 [Lipomyces tetrasporus]